MATRPEICGFYSINDDREYEDSVSSLRYFIKPNLPINLNRGIENLKLKPDEYYQEKMEKILTFLVHHKSEFLQKNKPTNGRLIPSTEFITYRGILRMVMCSKVSPYPWTIIATKYKGNIYLCQHTTPEELANEKNKPAAVKRFCSYGPMFEHFCLSELPNKRPDTSQICNASSQFFCVFKRSLANRQFLFAAEMDGAESKVPLDPHKCRNWKPNQFVELKMNCLLSTGYRIASFNKVKAHSLWAQSYLSGVEKVYIGFRDDAGNVLSIRCYSIAELESLSRENWTDPMSGFEFLQSFLSRLEYDFRNVDCPYSTIKYHFDATTKHLSSTTHRGKTEYSLLPKWYLREMK